MFISSLGKNILQFALSKNVFSQARPVIKIELFLWVSKDQRKSRSRSSRRNKHKTPRDTNKYTRDTNKYRDLKVKHKKTRAKKRLRRRKMIKIRVYRSDQSGMKGEEIATLKKKFEKSEFQKLALPVSKLGGNAYSKQGQNSGQNLWLRVECKRCTRKTRMKIVYNRSDLSRLCRNQKRKKRKSRRKNKYKKQRGVSNKRRLRKKSPDCSAGKVRRLNKLPFLLITEIRNLRRTKRSFTNTRLEGNVHKNITKPSSIENEIPHRETNFISRTNQKVNRITLQFKKRNQTRNQTSVHSGLSYSKLQSRHERQQIKTNFKIPKETIKVQCSIKPKYVDFKELSLDDQIIYPAGFTSSECVGACDIVSPKYYDNSQFKTLFNILTKQQSERINTKSTPFKRLFDVSYFIHKNITDIIKNSEKSNWLPQILKASAEHSSHRLSNTQTFATQRKRRRLKSETVQCVPVQRQSLVIVHFDLDHNIVVSEIPDFIITKCGCNTT